MIFKKKCKHAVGQVRSMNVVYLASVTFYFYYFLSSTDLFVVVVVVVSCRSNYPHKDFSNNKSSVNILLESKSNQSHIKIGNLNVGNGF